MIKVAVVDDHKLFRKSLCALIETFNGIQVVIEAENGREFLSLIPNKHIDVLLLDLSMPVMDGFETCKATTELYPSVKILIVSHIISKDSIVKAVAMGAHGYFSKNADPEYLEIALRSIHIVGFYFEPGISPVLHEMILPANNDNNLKDPLRLLSDKEIDVISLVCSGYTNDEIADNLSVNIRTVESYRKRILDKTDARNFTLVILMAIKYNYVSVENILSRAF
jgi:two-component system response regulator DegU